MKIAKKLWVIFVFSGFLELLVTGSIIILCLTNQEWIKRNIDYFFVPYFSLLAIMGISGLATLIIRGYKKDKTLWPDIKITIRKLWCYIHGIWVMSLGMGILALGFFFFPIIFDQIDKMGTVSVWLMNLIMVWYTASFCALSVIMGYKGFQIIARKEAKK